MRHGTWDTLKDYLTVTKLFLIPSYNKTILCDAFLDILGNVHLAKYYSVADTIVTQNLTDYGN